MQTVSRGAALALCLTLGLLLVSAPVISAPKIKPATGQDTDNDDNQSKPKPKPNNAAPGQSALQPLFAQLKIDTQPDVNQKTGEIVYSLTSNNPKLQITVDEMTKTGNTWIWTVVAESDGKLPATAYKRVAEANDAGRTGYYMSVGPSLDQDKAKAGAQNVFLNGFFQTRTADSQLLQDYLDKAISETQRCQQALSDILEK